MTILGQAPRPCGGHTLLSVGSTVLRLGGFDRRGEGTTSAFFTLDTSCEEHLKWAKVELKGSQGALRAHRTAASMTLIGDHVYVFGGLDPTTGLCFNSIVKVDTALWTAEIVKPTTGAPSARHGHCAGVLRGAHLLVYGGADQQSRLLGDVWAFNTVSSEWTRVEVDGRQPRAREMATGTMLDEARMLVCGGRGDGAAVLQDALILDLSAKAWQRPISHPALARCSHSATLLRSPHMVVDGLHNCVVLFGGYSGGGLRSDMVVIDPEEMSVVEEGIREDSPATGSPGARFAHAACTITSASGRDAMLVHAGMREAEDLNDTWLWIPEQPAA